MSRVVLHERVEDYNKKRLLKIQELTGGKVKGLSRGQILDDIIWLAEKIICHPERFKNDYLIMRSMERILEAIKRRESEDNEKT